MRLRLLVMSMLLCATVASAKEPTAAEHKEIIDAMNAWIAAVNAQDVAALQKILHDELIFVHSDARTQGKAEVLKDIAAGRGAAGVLLEETVVRIYGNTALVKAKVTARGRPKNGVFPPLAAGRQPNIISCIHTLVKGAGGWQLVTRQATRPPAPATAGR